MMDDKWVTAIATAVGSAATIGAAIIAWVQLDKVGEQIRQASEADRRSHTLEACQRFEKDILLKRAMRNLYRATHNGSDYSKLGDDHEFDALTVLNYLDGIAMGIEQRVYIEAMAKDYLDDTVQKAVKALILGESGDGWKSDKKFIDAKYFVPLCDMYKRWNPQPATAYRAD
jgi:hypothetical protein